MTKSPEEQQRTDAMRIPEGGTGKLDEHAPRMPEPLHPESTEEDAGADVDPALIESLRERMHREREAAIAELRAIGVSPYTEEDLPRTAIDEGDAAEVSEQQDIAFARRELLAERINRLTAALERIAQGRYGRCTMCGRPIGANRLQAAPETELCLDCQRRREGQVAAAA